MSFLKVVLHLIKRDYLNISTWNNNSHRPDVIQWSATRLMDLSVSSQEAWQLRDKQQLMFKCQWAVRSARVMRFAILRRYRRRSDVFGRFRLRGTVTQSESEHRSRPCRRRCPEFCLNSYILYECVIEKSHYVHQRHIRTSVFFPPISCTVQETLFKKALHWITSAHGNESCY